MRAGVILAFGAFILLTWLPRAWAARWIADDYCFAVSAVRDGFWRSQAIVYNNASGRFTVAFLYAVLTHLGPGAARWLPIGAVASWLASAWFVARRFAFTPLEQIAAAVGFVAAVINAAPDVYQPLIWSGGLFTYGVPVIGATFIAAILPRSAVLAAVVAFITGGCSEVAAAAQIVFASAFAYIAPRNRRAFIAVAIASAIALLIVGIAPGNFQRRTLFHPLSVSDAVVASIEKTPAMYAQILVEGSTMFVPLMVFLCGCRLRPALGGLKPGATLIVAAVVVVTATLFGALVGTGRLPWGRVQFVPVAYVTIAIAFVALAMRIERYTLIATVVMIIFGLIGLIGMTPLRMQAIRDAQQFARAADRIGSETVVEAPQSFEYLDYVSRDPNHWTNRCMAAYYGLPSIRSRGERASRPQ